MSQQLLSAFTSSFDSDVFCWSEVLLNKVRITLFTREDGTIIGDFRKTWYRVCCNIGLGRMACRVGDRTVTADSCECGSSDLHYAGLLIHHLRRTGSRNLRRLVFTKKRS
jgi:hypothetical protein